MTIQTATIQVRIDQRTKSQAQAIFKKLGLDISTATKMFLRNVIKNKSMSYPVLTVNGFTPEYEKMIIEEVEAMKRGEGKSFKTIKELMADLNS